LVPGSSLVKPFHQALDPGQPVFRKGFFLSKNGFQAKNLLEKIRNMLILEW
jgi:hypothetical protein